jgi:hypothetical protein
MSDVYASVGKFPAAPWGGLAGFSGGNYVFIFNDLLAIFDAA